MKIYVASKFEEKPRVREVMAELIAAGHTITHDWTTSITDFNVTGAINDLRGVADADIFVGVFEKDLEYKGALVELGAALALGKPVYILGEAPFITKCIFIKHPNVKLGRPQYRWDLVTPPLEHQPKDEVCQQT